MEKTEGGLVASGDGWFVLNAKDARWYHAEGRPALCNLEGETFFSQFGIHIVVLWPGQPMAMYHWEADQEDFLVLSGDALLIVEGEERPLLALDDQERLTGHDEEVLLVDLPVVHRHRLARQEHLDVHADLREVLLALEVAEGTASFAVVPARVARVQDIPPVSGRDEPVLGLLELCLGNHGPSLVSGAWPGR